jgi:hypothetical protein
METAMPLLVPRLQISESTAAKLDATARERGVSASKLITEFIEECVATRREAPPDNSEILNRLVLVGEKMGLVVGGPSRFPVDWVRLGGITDEECSRIAANYIEWRRIHDEDRKVFK